MRKRDIAIQQGIDKRQFIMSRIFSKNQAVDKLLKEQRQSFQEQREKKAIHYEKMWQAKKIRDAKEEDNHSGCRSQICEFSHTKKERIRPPSTLSHRNTKSPARSYRSLLGVNESFMDQPLNIRRTHSSHSLNHKAVYKRQKQFYDEAKATIERKRQLMDSAQSKRE